MGSWLVESLCLDYEVGVYDVDRSKLKYFFNSSIRRVANEDIASESVKQAIKRRMPFLLDLLTLLMEAGSTFLGAIRQAVVEFEGHPVAEEFGREHDHFRLLGQHNIRRYLPASPLRIRVHEDDSAFELFAHAVRLGDVVQDDLESELVRLLHRWLPWIGQGFSIRRDRCVAGQAQ